MKKDNQKKQQSLEKSLNVSSEQNNQWKIPCKEQKFKRKRYFFEAAKQYIEAVQSDSIKKSQFNRKYFQYIQSVEKSKQQQLDQLKQEKMRKKQMRQLMAQKINAKVVTPCRRSCRKFSRDIKSLASSELGECATIIEPSKSLITNQADIFFKTAQNKNQAQQIEQQEQPQAIQTQEKLLKVQQDMEKEIVVDSFEQNSDVFQSKLNGKQESQDLKQIDPFFAQPKLYNMQDLPHADRNLLKIQQKIDKFIIYNRQTRLRPYVYIDKLINYINESENFFFNRKMFEKLQSVNEDLYKTQQGLTKQTLLIRGKQLSNETVKLRLNKTLSLLIKLNFGIQNQELNKQEKIQKIPKAGKKIVKDKGKAKKGNNFCLTDRILTNKNFTIAASLDDCFKNISNN